MQMEWLFSGLLPDYDGFWLFLVIVLPGVVLALLAWWIEQSIRQSVGATVPYSGWLRTSYETHPRRWTLIHRIFNNLAVYLFSQWMLFVYGFIFALVFFVFFVTTGSGGRSLSDTSKS